MTNLKRRILLSMLMAISAVAYQHSFAAANRLELSQKNLDVLNRNIDTLTRNINKFKNDPSKTNQVNQWNAKLAETVAKRDKSLNQIELMKNAQLQSSTAQGSTATLGGTGSQQASAVRGQRPSRNIRNKPQAVTSQQTTDGAATYPVAKISDSSLATSPQVGGGEAQNKAANPPNNDPTFANQGQQNPQVQQQQFAGNNPSFGLRGGPSGDLRAARDLGTQHGIAKAAHDFNPSMPYAAPMVSGSVPYMSNYNSAFNEAYNVELARLRSAPPVMLSAESVAPSAIEPAPISAPAEAPAPAQETVVNTQQAPTPVVTDPAITNPPATANTETQPNTAPTDSAVVSPDTTNTAVAGDAMGVPQ